MGFSNAKKKIVPLGCIKIKILQCMSILKDCNTYSNCTTDSFRQTTKVKTQCFPWCYPRKTTVLQYFQPSQSFFSTIFMTEYKVTVNEQHIPPILEVLLLHLLLHMQLWIHLWWPTPQPVQSSHQIWLPLGLAKLTLYVNSQIDVKSKEKAKYIANKINKSMYQHKPSQEDYSNIGNESESTVSHIWIVN